jgi:hypothetical protein
VVNSGDSEESEVPALLNATRRVTPVKIMMINLERGKDEGIECLLYFQFADSNYPYGIFKHFPMSVSTL